MQTTSASGAEAEAEASLQNHLPFVMNVGFYTEVVDKYVENDGLKSLGS